MSMGSNIFGVSVRAWLALIVVTTGLAFLYVAAIIFSGTDGVLLTVITSVTTFIGLALGYYLGSKPNTDTNGGANGSHDKPV
jgi:hypothetical protein